MPFTPPLTPNQKTIISSLNIKDWDEAVIAFAGLTKEQILTQLVERDPSEENMELMELIFREMPRYLDVKQVATMTGLSLVTVTKKCTAGKLPGAVKRSHYRWSIPATAARTLKRQPSRWDKTLSPQE